MIEHGQEQLSEYSVAVYCILTISEQEMSERSRLKNFRIFSNCFKIL